MRRLIPFIVLLSLGCSGDPSGDDDSYVLSEEAGTGEPDCDSNVAHQTCESEAFDAWGVCSSEMCNFSNICQQAKCTLGTCKEPFWEAVIACDQAHCPWKPDGRTCLAACDAEFVSCMDGCGTMCSPDCSNPCTSAHDGCYDACYYQ